MTVRPATRDDLPFLLAELDAFDRFFASSHSLFPDRDYAETFVTGLIDAHPFFVACKGDEPVGFIAGHVGPHVFNPAITQLTELFWWVRPEARGSRAGALLLRAFEDVGRRCADQIVMTLEADSPVSPSSLTHRGYRPTETNYLMEIS